VTRGSRLGWPVETTFAAAAGLAGYGAIQIVAGGGAGGEAESAALLVASGPREALAAGTALAALAIGPVLVGRDVLRLGVGLTLGMQAAQLVRVGLAGSPSALEQIVTGGLTVAVAAGVATLAVHAIGSGGSLEVSGRRRAAAGPGSPAASAALGTQPGRDAAGKAPDAGDDPPAAPPRPATARPRSGIGRRSVPGR
jgi:hypothetical protein